MASKLIRLSRNVFKSNGIIVASMRQMSQIASSNKNLLLRSSTNGQQCAVLLQPSVFNKILNNKYSTEKPTRSQLEEKVLEILRQFDRVKENPSKPDVKLTSHLTKDLGLDSLDHVEIIVQLEDAFGYEIPDSDYEKLLTPNEIVNYLEKRLVEV